MGKFGCSESVMLAFREALPGLVPEAAVAMSSTFRGGQGSGCLCGALAAAQMVLGAAFGYRGTAGGEPDSERSAKCAQLAKELHDAFKGRNKSTCCRVLTHGLAKGSPELQANCQGLVESATSLVCDILAREAKGL